MSRRTTALILSATLLCLLAACNGSGTGDKTNTDQAGSAISGRIEAGLRVLTIDSDTVEAQNFTIYRGDYVRLESTSGQPVTVVIPELKVSKTYPVAEGEKAYFKVPQPGSYAYTIGQSAGIIEAIAYQASGYQEVSALEGAELIKNIDPFILDVRTAGEFAGGHLADAHLLPVQVLQQELGQLESYKEEPVFVYCASGNRSTVAAKMLMDNGFTNVTNLNGGIRAWLGAQLPVVK